MIVVGRNVIKILNIKCWLVGLFGREIVSV